MGKQISANDKQSLTVTDNRTNQTYTIPITRNSINATAFKSIKIPKGGRFSEGAKDGRDEDEEEGGLRVYDPGFLNTAVVSSEITYIDGEEGILRYRGYPIEQIASSSSFLEVAYLLLFGELPTQKQHNKFVEEVMHHTYVHVDMDKIISAFRYDAHPMAVLASSFSALGAFFPEANPSLQGQRLYTRASGGEGKEKQREALETMDKQIYRILGKSITLAAMSYRVRQGRPFNRPPAGMGFTESFLFMLDHLGETGYKPNPVFAKALDILFILHADHEMNCSTSSVMLTGSSLVDPYSSIAAGCSALYGPLHGGANEAVIRMLIDIGSPDKVPGFIERVKRKEATLSGFGHRVYRNTDPRSKIIREVAEEVFKVTGKDELLETALTLRDAALKDEYFISRKLYPNVDFFSGLVYRAMGFPLDFFPILFAVPRTVGWIAHWRQMMLQKGGVKIWRPRQLYVGAGKRDYVPIERRSGEEQEDLTKKPATVPHLGSRRVFLADYAEKAKARASKL